MRHRSSVAVVESDKAELHLVLSPARSIDTHVVRCVPTSSDPARSRAPRKDVPSNRGVRGRPVKRDSLEEHAVDGSRSPRARASRRDFSRVYRAREPPAHPRRR